MRKEREREGKATAGQEVHEMDREQNKFSVGGRGGTVASDLERYRKRGRREEEIKGLRDVSRRSHRKI